MPKKVQTTRKAEPLQAPAESQGGSPEQLSQADSSTPENTTEVRRKSMGKKAMQRAAAMDETKKVTPKSAPVVARDVLFERIPQVSSVAGAAMQADIMELNRAVIRLLQTAARLGEAEPLSPLLLGTSAEMIELFMDPGHGERLLAQSIGFPLVQLRIHDVGVMRQLLSDGLVSASSVQGLTRSFPLEVLETATRQTRAGS